MNFGPVKYVNWSDEGMLVELLSGACIDYGRLTTVLKLLKASLVKNTGLLYMIPVLLVNLSCNPHLFNSTKQHR